jgi:hypothetical protein
MESFEGGSIGAGGELYYELIRNRSSLRLEDPKLPIWL